LTKGGLFYLYFLSRPSGRVFFTDFISIIALFEFIQLSNDCRRNKRSVFEKCNNSQSTASLLVFRHRSLERIGEIAQLSHIG